MFDSRRINTTPDLGQMDREITVRLFVTVAGPSSTPYPNEEDEPTVYYARSMGQVTYPKTPGAQVLTAATLDEFAHVYYFGDYLEVGTLVYAVNWFGYWHVVRAAQEDDNGHKPRLGATDATHAINASGSVTVYTGTPGSETESEETITAWNRLQSLPADSWVICTWINDAWYITNFYVLPILGKVYSSPIAKNASGLVEIWSGTAGSETATGQQITVWNRMEQLPVGSWVVCHWIQGHWELTNFHIIPVLGKVYSSAIAKDDDGLVEIYSGTQGSETATGQQITVWNRLEKLPVGAWVICTWVDGGWELTNFKIAPKLGKTYEAIDKGDTGTVAIWAGTKGSESATGEQVEVYNRWGDLEIGLWVLIFWVDGGWEFTTAECEAA